MHSLEIPLQSPDSHRWSLLARVPARPTASLLWLPALGVGAKHYLAFADALARRDIAVFVHEWRGNGSSDVRASRERDWGYRELLTQDLPISEAAVRHAVPQAERILGGHSLGGQLACCRLALAPQTADQIWLVASGSPYWRAFPPPTRYWLPAVYRFLPWLTNRLGALPGRRLGFGGQEARGLIADWSRSALSGRYAAHDLDIDLEASLAELTPAVHGVALSADWLAPESSLRFLLSKMPMANALVTTLDSAALAARADHFSWMKQPDSVVDALLG